MSVPDFSTTVIQLRRAQTGDQQALNDLLVRYLPRVRNAVAMSLGRMPNQISDLDDVLQEVLISASANLGDFEPRSDGTFMSWLATIAINKVRDQHRHAGRKKRGGGAVRGIQEAFNTSTLSIPIPAPDPRPSQLAQANEIEAAQMAALLKLEPRYREVIVDRDILGMSYEEIAEKLGYKTPDPPRALYSRAKGQLRKLLRSFDVGGVDGHTTTE